MLGYSPFVLVKLAIQEKLSAKNLSYDVEVKPAA
jgi:hypothetical protein